MRQILDKRIMNLVQFPFLEPMVLPQLRRPKRTMQFEYGLASLSNHMHVSRPMIVRKDHYNQTVELQYIGHCPKTKAV